MDGNVKNKLLSIRKIYLENLVIFSYIFLHMFYTCTGFVHI